MCVLEEFPSHGPFVSGSREKVLCHKEGNGQKETDTRCSIAERWNSQQDCKSRSRLEPQESWMGRHGSLHQGTLAQRSVPISWAHTGDLGGRQVDSLCPRV